MIEENKQPDTRVVIIKNIVELVFREKWIIILCTFLGFLHAGSLYFNNEPVYRSEARLLIRYVSDSTRIEPNSGGENIRIPADRNGESIISSELEILTSQDLIESVIQDIGSEQFTAIPPRFLANFALRNLSVDVPPKSSVIRLSFHASNPELAQSFLNKLIENYLRKHIAIHSELGVSDFLSRQTDQMRARLTETEEKLRRLYSSAGIISIDDAKLSVARRIEILRVSIQQAEVDLASARAVFNLTQGSVAAPATDTNMPAQSATVASSPVTNVATSVEKKNRIYAVQLYERLREQQKRESAMLAVYTPDSQPVRSLRLQIEETQKILAGLPLLVQPIAVAESGVTNLEKETTSAEMQVVSLKAKIKSLQESLAQTQIEAQQIDKNESDIMELKRSKEIQEANYKYFVQSLEQARIDNTLNAQNFSSISIVQPATLPVVKLRPNLSRSMVRAVVMGFFCGLGIAFLKGWLLNQTFRRPEELEAALRIPVLISIPYIPALNGSWNNRAAKRKRKPAVVPAGGDPFSEAPIWKTFRELEEYFETFKDHFLAATRSAPEKPCMVAFTGCFSGAGVTTLAAGLALILARDGNDRVLLVDANFGQPMAQKLLGMNSATGLADMLATGKGDAAAVQRNLYFLSSGQPGEEMSGKSFSQSMANVIRCLKDRPYRFILFDTASVTDTRVALRICQMMDGVVLVIDADKTDRAAVSRAAHILNRGGDRTLGIVFNRQRLYTPRWIARMS